VRGQGGSEMSVAVDKATKGLRGVNGNGVIGVNGDGGGGGGGGGVGAGARRWGARRPS